MDFQLKAVPLLSRIGADRADQVRTDVDAAAAGWPDAALLRLDSRNQVMVADGKVLLGKAKGLADKPPPDAVFLGRMADGRHVWAVRGPLESPEDPDLKAEVADLRRAGQLFDDVGAQLVSAAAALLNWHASSRFSAIDGSPTKPIRAGWARVNPVTGHEEFPRIDPAIICLVHDGGDRAVLARQTVWPDRMFSLLAGFVEAGESFETCVAREIHEEIGLTVSDIRYLGSQPWPFPAVADDRLPRARRSRGAVRVQRRRDRRGRVVHPRRDPRRAGPRRLEQRLRNPGCCCPDRCRSPG